MIKSGLKPSGDILQNISFRAIDDDDLGFLCQLYGTTRAEELAMLPWPEQQKAEFIQMQFDAQHSYYQQQFPDADFLIIQRNEQNIGRVYIDRRQDEIRLIDIVLIPQNRNLGIGGKLLELLTNEATQHRLPIRIHVEKSNPAMRLYQKLAFKVIEDKGVYDLLEWQPALPKLAEN